MNGETFFNLEKSFNCSNKLAVQSDIGNCYFFEGGGGNSYRGLGIHVPAQVMGQFAIFCPGYRSCFVNLALVIGPGLHKFALVMVKC